MGRKGRGPLSEPQWGHKFLLLLAPSRLPAYPKRTASGEWCADFDWDRLCLRFHQEVRRLVDQHVLQTASGQFSRVMRFGRDVLFKSIQERPIYASVPHMIQRDIGRSHRDFLGAQHGL